MNSTKKYRKLLTAKLEEHNLLEDFNSNMTSSDKAKMFRKLPQQWILQGILKKTLSNREAWLAFNRDWRETMRLMAKEMYRKFLQNKMIYDKFVGYLAARSFDFDGITAGHNYYAWAFTFFNRAATDEGVEYWNELQTEWLQFLHYKGLTNVC